VAAMLAAKFPPGSKLVIDRLSDGKASGGFTWHRERVGAEGQIGLRGTLYAELDGSGAIAYVREGAEPIWKAGEATEALLKAATALVDKPEREKTFSPDVPKTASGVARYLWEECYPNGGEPTDALRLFAEDIRYEDFNYEQPFLGKAAVTDFVTAFDIPGVAFVPLRISEGARACAFTWRVLINGQEGPEGISFYEVDAQGKVCFVRDIPAPSLRPPPFGALAATVDPQLRVLRPREAV